MAQMTIHYNADPATGWRGIVVALRPDDDTPAHEHERQHRRLVESLIGRAPLPADDGGNVTVEREVNTMPVMLGGG
jgi:hypothetical protein